jgi:hypothetical protein
VPEPHADRAGVDEVRVASGIAGREAAAKFVGSEALFERYREALGLGEALGEGLSRADRVAGERIEAAFRSPRAPSRPRARPAVLACVGEGLGHDTVVELDVGCQGGRCEEGMRRPK